MNINKTKKIKYKSRFSIKIFLSHIFGILVLLALTNYTISYSKGEFELPFYDRAKNAGVKIDSDIIPRDWDNIIASEEKTTEDVTSVIDRINPEDFVLDSESGDSENSYSDNNAETTEPAHDFELFSDDMKRQGFSASDGIYEIYDEAKANADINRYKTELNRISNENENQEDESLLLPLPEKPVIYEYKFARIEPAIEIPVTQTVLLDSYNVKLTVETCMDYMIIRTEENEILCSASGKIITRDFDLLGLTILKMRDREGRAVFKSKDGYYYYFDPEAGETGNGAFVGPIIFDEILTGDRGVPFMYPSYYGADGANGLNRFYFVGYTRKWGYLDSDTANVKIPRNYEQTFNFRENIGIAYQDSPGRGNKLFFLDENGYNYLSTNYSYFAPDTVNKNHLGFFYFDHGLTRVYEREFDRRSGAITERELIVNIYGKPFYIPEDYNIKAYSDGMILLEKNGYYGFMNYLGEWVANPIFTYAQPFYEGVAVIGLENGKKALIDTQGNLVAKFKYNAITNCTGGIVALFEKDQGWTILNKVRRQINID
ncbi:MAG: WG repeat-containing protein [Oscillospiraceae bacterium]|nr:WG repeat-containing protein [Oscillospiraceae bacterium]